VLCPGNLQTSAGTTACSLDLTRAPTYSSFAIATNPAWQRKPLVSAADVNVFTYEAAGGRVHDALDPAAVGAFLEWITEELGPSISASKPRRQSPALASLSASPSPPWRSIRTTVCSIGPSLRPEAPSLLG